MSNALTLFWIDPLIRDAYPRDKAERISEDSATRESDRDSLLASLAQLIARTAKRSNGEHLESVVETLRPLVFRFEPDFYREKRISLFDPTSFRFSEKAIISSTLAIEVAESAVNYLKHRYHASVTAIAEDLILRAELESETLSEEEAYVYQEKYYVIEKLREENRTPSFKP